MECFKVLDIRINSITFINRIEEEPSHNRKDEEEKQEKDEHRRKCTNRVGNGIHQ
jgi:hypothetical protein